MTHDGSSLGVLLPAAFADFFGANLTSLGPLTSAGWPAAAFGSHEPVDESAQYEWPPQLVRWPTTVPTPLVEEASEEAVAVEEAHDE